MLSRLGRTHSFAGVVWMVLGPELVVAGSRALEGSSRHYSALGSRALICYRPSRKLLMLHANLEMPLEVHAVMKKDSVDGQLYLSKSYPG